MEENKNQAITVDNFDVILLNYTKGLANKMDCQIRKAKIMIAMAIKCSIYTLNRLMTKETLPTDEMLRQFGILCHIGIERYSKLSNEEREKLSNRIALIAGGTGSVSVPILIAVLGDGAAASTIAWALGAIGGSMVGGLIAVAAAPLLIGVGIYGIFKLLGHIWDSDELPSFLYKYEHKYDEKYEYHIEDVLN